MTRFCPVRHGETLWNIEGRYQGQTDVPLSEAGRVQARFPAQKLQRS
jgi:broad specificity phosphatase PhoE